jgi:hypothetical protein
MHVMTSLVQFATPEATRDFATMRGWTKGDHSIFSLRNMRRDDEIIHPWGEQATVAGKESLQSAIRRLERSMRALWDNSFLRVFEDFEELCDGVYKQITGGYAQDMFEKVLHRWSYDVGTRDAWSDARYTDTPMSTPEDCSYMLRIWMTECWLEFQLMVSPQLPNPGSLKPFPPPPHHPYHCFPHGGFFTVVNRDKGLVPTNLGTQDGSRRNTGHPNPTDNGAQGSTTTTSGRQDYGSRVCMYHAASTLGITDSRTTTALVCTKGTSCIYDHVQSVEVLKTKITEDHIKAWKTSTGNQEAMRGKLGITPRERKCPLDRE